MQVSQAAPAREPNGEAPFNAHAGTIRGTVFDRQDNPLAGVTVGLVAVTGETRAATTNAQGRYEIAGIPPGRCTLSARKAGLAPQRQVVDSLRARQVLGVSFRLGPWSVVPWSISGTVTHEDGKTPFAGATVRHYRERVPGHWEWGSEQTTDDTGAFAFPNLPAGRYRVFLFAPGCFPRWVPGLALRPGSDHQEVNLILFAAPGQARPGTLPLEALGPDGRPLANTMGRIVLRGDTLFTGPSWGMGMIPIANRERPLGLMVRREIEGWVTTDAAGRLECTVPPGTYRVTLRAVGCHPLTQPLSVVPGERGAPVQFRMAAGTDTLEDPGVPRVGAGAAPAAPAAVAATAPAVPAGTGAPAAPAAAPAGGTAAAPAAPAARSSIRGTLLRPDGRPLADSGAYLFGAPSRLAENGQYDRWAYLRDAYVRTDAAGRFEKRDAPAGQTSLSLKVRGYAEVQVAGVDLPAGDTAEQVFRLAGPALRATGRVLTPEGAPVEHAWVFAYRLLNRPKGDRIWSEAMDTSTGDDGDAHTPRLDRTPDETLPGSVPGLMQHGLTYTETDADGAFTLADLDAGTYDFGATAPNYSRETREKVDLRAGMPPLAFALVAHGGIEGRLLGPGGAPLNAASQMVVDLIAGDGNRVWSSATAMWNMLPDGRYHVADVPPGTYRLSITVDGCRPASREEVVVRPGAVTTGVDLSLEWAPRVVLRGRALKPDGRPAAGAVLWWRPGISRTGAEAIGMSAADGTFALDAPPAESGALHWRLAGYAPGVMEVAPRSAAGTPLEVRFSPSVTLRGSVRDVAGAALQAVRLYWCRQETAGTLLGLECMPETQTGPDGAFELTDVLAGPICLTVEKAGFLSVRETRDLAGQVGEVTLDMALQTGPAPGAANPVAPSLVPARPAERALEAPPAPATTPRPASAPDSRPVPTLPQPIRVGNASLLPPFAGAREDGAAALAVPRANARPEDLQQLPAAHRRLHPWRPRLPPACGNARARRRLGVRGGDSHRLPAVEDASLLHCDAGARRRRGMVLHTRGPGLLHLSRRGRRPAERPPGLRGEVFPGRQAWGGPSPSALRARVTAWDLAGNRKVEETEVRLRNNVGATNTGRAGM